MLLLFLITLLLLLISISHQDCNHTHLIPRSTREFSKSSSYESLRYICSSFVQNTHPNTHRKTYLQPVAEMSFRSLIFNNYSPQVCDPIHCLLAGVLAFPHCIPRMFALFLLKFLDLLKEPFSVTSSPYS
jgi:hypothetical protein